MDITVDDGLLGNKPSSIIMHPGTSTHRNIKNTYELCLYYSHSILLYDVVFDGLLPMAFIAMTSILYVLQFGMARNWYVVMLAGIL